jgi:hypothetical protein
MGKVLQFATIDSFNPSTGGNINPGLNTLNVGGGSDGNVFILGVDPCEVRVSDTKGNTYTPYPAFPEVGSTPTNLIIKVTLTLLLQAKPHPPVPRKTLPMGEDSFPIVVPVTVTVTNNPSGNKATSSKSQSLNIIYP